jgi:hypothetical protein
MIYGTGGIGKTILGCMLPGETVFIDIDKHLARLIPELTDNGFSEPINLNVNNWKELRTALTSGGWEKINNIVIDPINSVEDWCIANILDTVRTFDKPSQKANSLEDYGWGKDVRLVYENFLPLLGDLDRHARQGRNILLLTHECKPEEINPMGANYMRYEPRLRGSRKGENSIRLKVKEWCDVVGFYCYDIAPKSEPGKDADRTKKAMIGSGSKTLYFAEQPQFMAKKHGAIPESIDIVPWVSPWDQIIL